MSYPFDGDPKWDFSDREFQKRLDNFVHLFPSYVIVGWRKGSGWDLFHQFLVTKEIHLVDAYQPNVDDWIDCRNRKRLTRVDATCSPIEDCYKRLNPDACLIWQHGPEHLEIEKAKDVVRSLKEFFAGIVIETPNGPYPQGELYGNPYEKHLSSWYEKDYSEIFSPSRIGFYPRKNNIIAYA